MQSENAPQLDDIRFGPELCEMETLCAECHYCKSIPIQGNYGYCIKQDKIINHETHAQ